MRGSLLHRMVLLLLVIVTAGAAWADNRITLSSVSGRPGAEVEVTLALNNTDAVTGVQVTLPLDEHLTYVPSSAVLKAERSNGHSLSATETDGELRLMVYSLTRAQLKGTDGALLTFRLRLGNEPAAYPLQPEVTLGGTTSASLLCNVSGATATILAPKMAVDVSSIDFGHVPLGDSYTKTLKVSNTGTMAMMVNAVTFGGGSTTTPGSADEVYSVDAPSFSLGSGLSRTLTVTYTPAVRGAAEETMTLASDAVNGVQMVQLKADPYAVNELHTGSASGVSEQEVEIILSVNNMDELVGMQCAYLLPEELAYVEGSARLSDRSNGHSLSAVVREGRLLLTIYSRQKSLLKGHEGELLRFTLRLVGSQGSYTLTPTDVVLGASWGENVLSESYAGTVEIETPHLDCVSSLVMEDAPITMGATGVLMLRNVSSLPLTLSSVMFTTEGFACEGDFPIVIEGGQSHELPLTYKAGKAGAFEGVLNIYTNDPDHRMHAVTVTGRLYEPNTLEVEALSATSSTYAMGITLNNYSTIKGFQLDMHCSDGLSAEDCTLQLTDRLEGYTYTFKQVGENTCRLVVYSFNKALCVTGNQGEILQLHVNQKPNVSALFSVQNVVLSGDSDENLLTQGSVLSALLPTGARKLINLSVGPDIDVQVDKTRIVLNEEKSLDYELGCDAAKFISETADYQIYSLDAQGTQYQINERPARSGIIPLGLIVRSSGQIAIWASRMDTEVTIVDKITEVEHNLADGPYVFTSSAGTFNRRFEIHVPAVPVQADVNGDNRISIADIVRAVEVVKGSVPGNLTVEDIPQVADQLLRK